MPDLTDIKPYAVAKPPNQGIHKAKLIGNNGVMERYIVLTVLSLLICAGIAWQLLSTEPVFLDLGLAALMYLLIVVWRGSKHY